MMEICLGMIAVDGYTNALSAPVRLLLTIKLIPDLIHEVHKAWKSQ
ncbi:MAG: hypothetical protein P1Q69_04440 [Candidatus Thorarchaeota archaeon]|nr:hypothetical protein [Candidatus Thorarchaeota archaeon]